MSQQYQILEYTANVFFFLLRRVVSVNGHDGGGAGVWKIHRHWTI